MFKKIILISCLSMLSFNFANATNIPLYDAAGKCHSKKGKPYCYNMLEKEVKCKPFKDKAEMHSKNQEKLMKQGKKQEAKAEGQKAEKAATAGEPESDPLSAAAGTDEPAEG